MGQISRYFIPLFLTSLLTIISACSGSASKAGVPPENSGSDVSYFNLVEADANRETLDNKYSEIFKNERILAAISTSSDGRFTEWNDELRLKLLDMILFFEAHPDGRAMPPFEGSCVFDSADNPCYRMSDLPKPNMQLDSEYAEYIYLSQAAWHLFVEANHITPWSIADYSDENLAILFESALSQPRIWRQFFVANLDITENYRIVTGLLRERGDNTDTLVGETSLNTILNVTQFVGERVTHFRGSSSNGMGPSWAIWPYRARNEAGEALYDENGIRVPLPRLPTPMEILIFRDPHHDIRARADAANGPQYHVVNGCWGSSQLLKNLLASINIPVELVGDYFNFGSHSGVRFAEIEGNSYYLNHSDDFYLIPWTYGLLAAREELDGVEHWAAENFAPFAGYVKGYSVFHTSERPMMDPNEIIEALEIQNDMLDLFHRELPNPFGGLEDFSMRVLAIRAMSNTPSVQTLYGRCTEPDVNRRHMPLSYMTAEEEIAFANHLDGIINDRRIGMGGGANCFELFFNELNEIYTKKTGLQLMNDDDGDGFQNHRDCHPYLADDRACEGAFRQPISIQISG